MSAISKQIEPAPKEVGPVPKEVEPGGTSRLRGSETSGDTTPKEVEPGGTTRLRGSETSGRNLPKRLPEVSTGSTSYIGSTTTIYADAAATTPLRREVLQAMFPYLTGEFGNPSSAHAAGRSAAQALATARAQVASALGERPGEVVFTSGGTEANHLAIVGLALANPRGRHVVTSQIEHSSVLGAVEWLRRWHGFEVTFADVLPDGTVTPDALAAAMRPDTALVSIHHANNEVGTIQDVAALAVAARSASPGVVFHTDTVQSAAWLEASLAGLGVDALTISGHKLGGPKGIGALLVRDGVAIEPLLAGGGQERGRRSGTENVAGAVGLGAAAALLAGRHTAPETGASATAACRDALIAEVLARIPSAILTGPGPAEVVERLPGHASFCFPGTHGAAVLTELERLGVLASAGSACAAGSDEPSPVLLALGINPDVAVTSIRLTFDAPFDAGTVAAALATATSGIHLIT